MLHLLFLGSLRLYHTVAVKQSASGLVRDKNLRISPKGFCSSLPVEHHSLVGIIQGLSFRRIHKYYCFYCYNCDIGRIIIIRTLWLEYMIWHSTITNCVSELPAKLCFTFDNRPDQITIKIGTLTATGARFSKGHRPCHENG